MIFWNRNEKLKNTQTRYSILLIIGKKISYQIFHVKCTQCAPYFPQFDFLISSSVAVILNASSPNDICGISFLRIWNIIHIFSIMSARYQMTAPHQQMHYHGCTISNTTKTHSESSPSIMKHSATGISNAASRSTNLKSTYIWKSKDFIPVIITL